MLFIKREPFPQINTGDLRRDKCTCPRELKASEGTVNESRFRFVRLSPMDVNTPIR